MPRKKILSEEQEKEVLKLRNEGMKHYSLGINFGVSIKTIGRICKEEDYKTEKIINEFNAMGFEPEEIVEHTGMNLKRVKLALGIGDGRESYSAKYTEAKKNTMERRSKFLNVRIGSIIRYKRLRWNLDTKFEIGEVIYRDNKKIILRNIEKRHRKETFVLGDFVANERNITISKL